MNLPRAAPDLANKDDHKLKGMVKMELPLSVVIDCCPYSDTARGIFSGGKVMR